MVRGPGDEPRISGRPDYDGTLKEWQYFKIKLTSHLHEKGKWLVTKKGVAEKQPPQTIAEKQFQTPAPMMAPADQTPAPMMAPATSSTGSWKILVQNGDTMRSGQNGQKVLGSLEASKVLDMINSGEVDRDSSLISFSPAGFYKDFWEPFTAEKEVQLYRSLRSEANVTPMRQLETDPETDPMPTLYMPSELEEASDAKGRSEIDDVDAYHFIIDCVSVKGDTGKALVQRIDEKFSGMESGHKLFAWLDSRAKASGNNDGLVDADDAKADLLDFKIPAGNLSKEVIVVQGGVFRTLYYKQPPERHGMKQDIFMAWMEKLPEQPFDELITQLQAINLINKGTNVFEDFDEANKMLCALYSNWLKKNPLVVITESKDTPLEKQNTMDRALFVQRGDRGRMGWQVCYRCWKAGDHLSYECDKVASTCVTCGLDAAKARISCGGEYDPLKCMIKGYESPRKVPEAYMDKLRNWAATHNVKFGKPSDDVKTEPAKALVAYDPSQISWSIVDGAWVGS